MSDALTTKLAEALRCYVTGDEFNERTENQLYNQAREALRLHAEVERLSAPLAATQAAPPPELCEQVCAAIKAADDKSVDEAGYMLDSNDCIAIVRQEFARAALVATPAPAQQWQPIKTAPKDQSEFLLGVWEGSWGNPRKRFNVYQARGYPGGPAWSATYRTEEGEAYEIAGWMSLPAAPEAGQGKEASSARSVD